MRASGDELGASGDPTGATGSPTTTARAILDAGVHIDPELLHGLSLQEQAALLGDTDLSDGLDLGPPPPPPSADESIIPHERREARPDFVLGQREAGIHLIDSTLERLTGNAERLEQQGDVAGAQVVRARIERMRGLRARRESELEAMRQGREVPSADLEGAPAP
jgi:hypothetical protein